jgi:hypothetical protein
VPAGTGPERASSADVVALGASAAARIGTVVGGTAASGGTTTGGATTTGEMVRTVGGDVEGA